MTTAINGVKSDLSKSLLRGIPATVVLTLFFLYYILGKCSLTEVMVALPFFVTVYFVQFTLGREGVVEAFRKWIGNNSYNVFVFPTILSVFYLFYLVVNNQEVFVGNPWMLLYIIYFPVVVFSRKQVSGKKVGWIDFTVFVLTLLPSAFFSVKQNSELPVSGGGFDSVSHVLIILTGVYAFAIVRKIDEVGFVLDFKWKSLFTAVLVWAAFYLFVFVFGISVNFIAVTGYSEPVAVLVKSVLFSMIGTFLHTALFEELFFRGILQNLLSKRIAQGKSWLIFWQVGFILLFIGALLVGYTLDGNMKWFPALITVILFGAAYLIERSGKYGFGIYTSLAITGVTFGLVHYHAKSIIYIGLACVAGWAYGYTYIKTKSVFYSALVHMLVNSGVLIFGLKMIR